MLVERLSFESFVAHRIDFGYVCANERHTCNQMRETIVSCQHTEAQNQSEFRLWLGLNRKTFLVVEIKQAKRLECDVFKLHMTMVPAIISFSLLYGYV